jgi:hypothetical protein
MQAGEQRARGAPALCALAGLTLKECVLAKSWSQKFRVSTLIFVRRMVKLRQL